RSLPHLLQPRAQPPGLPPQRAHAGAGSARGARDRRAAAVRAGRGGRHDACSVGLSGGLGVGSLPCLHSLVLLKGAGQRRTHLRSERTTTSPWHSSHMPLDFRLGALVALLGLTSAKSIYGPGPPYSAGPVVDTTHSFAFDVPRGFNAEHAPDIP